jgi:TRAP-type C4-dicarboxylate transport system permease small subunit
MRKVIHLWGRIGIWISGITLVLLMLLTAVDVFGRYVLNHPITGTYDLTQVIMVIIIFLALSDTASTRGHIVVEVVTSQLSLRKGLILECVTFFASGIVAAAMAWRLGANGLYAFKHEEMTSVLEISKAPFISLAAIGCGMLAIALIEVSYEALLQVLAKKDGATFDRR